MTKVLDRLERGGYPHRSADPADRRRIVVPASAEGLAEVDRYVPIGEVFTRQLADYTDDGLRTVLKFMRDSREVSEGETNRIRGAGIPHASRSR
jgi:DNA-binding MarR family transcriptional regulator